MFVWRPCISGKTPPTWTIERCCLNSTAATVQFVNELSKNCKLKELKDWVFGDILEDFSFLDFKKKLKVHTKRNLTYTLFGRITSFPFVFLVWVKTMYCFSPWKIQSVAQNFKYFSCDVICVFVRRENMADKERKHVPGEYCVAGGTRKVSCTNTNATPGVSMHLFPKDET